MKDSAAEAIRRLREEERKESASAIGAAQSEVERARQVKADRVRAWNEFLEAERTSGYPAARLVRICLEPIDRRSFWGGKAQHEHGWNDGLGYWAGSTHAESGDRGYTTNWLVVVVAEAWVITTQADVITLGSDGRLGLKKGLRLCLDAHSTRAFPLAEAPIDLPSRPSPGR